LGFLGPYKRSAKDPNHGRVFNLLALCLEFSQDFLGFFDLRDPTLTVIYSDEAGETVLFQLIKQVNNFLNFLHKRPAIISDCAPSIELIVRHSRKINVFEVNFVGCREIFERLKIYFSGFYPGGPVG
jgi:hypothetical protein